MAGREGGREGGRLGGREGGRKGGRKKGREGKGWVGRQIYYSTNMFLKIYNLVVCLGERGEKGLGTYIDHYIYPLFTSTVFLFSVSGS